MPVLGKSKKEQQKDQQDPTTAGFRRQLISDDYDDDPSLLLDDATRKMIMQDIQRGRMPTSTYSTSSSSSSIVGTDGCTQTGAGNAINNVLGARGAGSSGAAYLLNTSATTTTPSSSTASTSSAALSKGLNLNSRRVVVPSTTSSSSNSSSTARTTGSTTNNTNKPSLFTHAPPPSSSLLRTKEPEENLPEKEEKKDKTPTTTSLDPELIDVMASRLRFLEKQTSFVQKELREKSIKLSDTQNKLTESQEAVAKLQTERFLLAEKNAAMSQFLADYNLSWVGKEKDDEKKENNNEKEDKQTEIIPPPKKFDLYSGNLNPVRCLDPNAIKNSNNNNSDTNNNNSRIYNSRNSPPANNNNNNKRENKEKKSQHFDFDLFVSNCEQLSAKLSQHQFQSEQHPHHKGNPQGFGGGGGGGGGGNSNTVVLRERDVVKVVVFSDGITVAGGPFRPFGWALCDAFVQDVLDGFFPYEYRGKYPEGFPIEVLDRRDERFIPLPSSFSHLSGEGDNTPTKRNNNNQNVRTLNDSPYTLRKKASQNRPTNALGRLKNPTTSGEGNNTNSSLFNDENNNNEKEKENLWKGQGKIVGGQHHPGAGSTGDVVTRDIILKRVPTRYITPSGRLINPAEGIRDFLGLPSTSSNNSTIHIQKNNKNDKSDRPKTPPRFSVMKEHQEAFEQEQKRRNEHQQQQKMLREQHEKKQSNNKQEQKSSMEETTTSTSLLLSTTIRCVRVHFPSGDICEVFVPKTATIQELHDIIEAVVPSHLTMPPVDLRNDALIFDNKQSEKNESNVLEEIVKEEEEIGMGERVPTGTMKRRMELHARFPNRTLMQREQSVEEAGVKHNEVVLVKWKEVPSDDVWW